MNIIGKRYFYLNFVHKMLRRNRNHRVFRSIPQSVFIQKRWVVWRFDIHVFVLSVCGCTVWWNILMTLSRHIMTNTITETEKYTNYWNIPHLVFHFLLKTLIPNKKYFGWLWIYHMYLLNIKIWNKWNLPIECIV